MFNKYILIFLIGLLSISIGTAYLDNNNFANGLLTWGGGLMFGTSIFIMGNYK